jgi:radical SAM protein with 4Fe4S-binding SPASM domain
MIFITISKDNAGLIDKIMEIGDEIGADNIIIYYSWFTTEEIGNKHVSIFQDKLDCTPEAWKGYLLDYNQIDIEALQESVRRVKSKKFNFPYMFIPDIPIESIPDYYKHPDKLFGYDNCVAPWLIAEVMPNGDVAPCRDYPDYIVGNIRENSIVDIFNNDRYRKFRMALKECGGLFPICARCCGLMGF